MSGGRWRSRVCWIGLPGRTPGKHLGTRATQALWDAARTHPVLIDADGERVSPNYAPHVVLDDCNMPLASPDEPQPGARFMFNFTNLAETRRYAAAQAARLGLSADRTHDVPAAVPAHAHNT